MSHVHEHSKFGITQKCSHFWSKFTSVALNWCEYVAKTLIALLLEIQGTMSALIPSMYTSLSAFLPDSSTEKSQVVIVCSYLVCFCRCILKSNIHDQQNSSICYPGTIGRIIHVHVVSCLCLAFCDIWCLQFLLQRNGTLASEKSRRTVHTSCHKHTSVGPCWEPHLIAVVENKKKQIKA